MKNKTFFLNAVYS